MADIKKILGTLTVLQRIKILKEWARRNIQWVDRFEEAHQNYDRIFLIGGLAHFVNPASVVDWLKRKAYTVEPVICKQ